MKTLSSIALLVGLCMFAAPSYAQNAEWEATIAAAKKEGQVTVYSGFPGAPEPKEIAKQFEARYGIAVKFLEGRTAEIQERIRTEVTTGHALGDVSLNGGNSHYALKKMELLQLPGQIPNMSRVVVKSDMQEEVPLFLSSYAIAINTRLVSPGEEPKSWMDLTNPKWKGKILSDDPTAPGGGSTWFAVLYDKLGAGLHEKLAAQNLQYSRTIRENPRRVARGEFAIYIPLVLTDLAPLEGLPIKGIIPTEGLPYSGFSVAMIRNAKNQNAARLLMNFFLEPDSQLVYAKAGFQVVTDGLHDKIPEKLRWMVEAPLMGKQDPDRRDDMLKIASEIYKVN